MKSADSSNRKVKFGLEESRKKKVDAHQGIVHIKKLLNEYNEGSQTIEEPARTLQLSPSLESFKSRHHLDDETMSMVKRKVRVQSSKVNSRNIVRRSNRSLPNSRM